MFRNLAESFDRHQIIDSGTEASAALLTATARIGELARAAGATVKTLEDNAFTHRPIDLTPAEIADTREAIAAAALRSLP